MPNENAICIKLKNIFGEDKPFWAYIITNRSAAEPLHWHDFYQTCYVERGSIIHQHSYQDILLTDGDLLIIPPHFPHRLIISDSDTVVYSLYFHKEFFEPMDILSAPVKQFLLALLMDSSASAQRGVKLKVRLNDTQQQTYEAMFTCLLREMESNVELRLSAVNSIINALLLIVAQGYSENPGGKQQMNLAYNNSEAILRCMAYIDQHYMEDITVTKLLSLAAISRSSFNTLFPEISGTSFKTYLSRCRIRHAIDLLSVPSMTLTEISEAVGYQDFSTFYRNFIKVTGVSPSAYRVKTVVGLHAAEGGQ